MADGPQTAVRGAPPWFWVGHFAKLGHSRNRFGGAFGYAPSARSALSSPWQHAAGAAQARTRGTPAVSPWAQCSGGYFLENARWPHRGRCEGPSARDGRSSGPVAAAGQGGEVGGSKRRGGPTPCRGRNFCRPPIGPPRVPMTRGFCRPGQWATQGGPWLCSARRQEVNICPGRRSGRPQRGPFLLNLLTLGARISAPVGPAPGRVVVQWGRCPLPAPQLWLQKHTCAWSGRAPP